MNLLRKTFITPIKLLVTVLSLQVLFISNSHAVNVSINGSESLTLMNDILFDYSSSPRTIDFDIANPFVCTAPFFNANPTTIINVNSILDGNNVLSAAFDYSQNIFKVNTEGNIQCASELGIHNDTIYQNGMESTLNNVEIVLKDMASGAILNSASNLELHDGQLYQYKYEIRNTSASALSVDVFENYLKGASPTFARDILEGWDCSVISGSFTNCGDSTAGSGYVSLQNAVIGAFGQLTVVVTRRVSVDTAGSIHRLDLLAAVFLNNNVFDSNQFNNVAFTSFGTTEITATELNIINQPSDTVSGAAISTVVVEMLDGNGIVDASNNGLVTISINPSSPSGGVLSGTVQRNAVNGVATFAGLNIDKAGTNYKLRVSSSGLTNDISDGFNILPGAATQLAVIGQPSVAVAETIMTPVLVHVLDNNNNIATNYNGRVFANIKSGIGNLSGTSNPFANSGVVVYNNLSIDQPGIYTLQFSSGALQGTVSDSFEITAVPSAANSVFGVNIDSQVAGTNATYSAIIRDANNTPVGAGVTVSFTMQNSLGANTQNTSCVTALDGSCSVQTTSTIVGTTTVSASIPAGSITNLQSGLFDLTTWLPGAADAQQSSYGVDLNSQTTGENVTYSAIIKDQYGNLVGAGIPVIFSLTNSNGATAPTGLLTCNTNVSSECSISATSNTTGDTSVNAAFGFPKSTSIVGLTSGLFGSTNWQ